METRQAQVGQGAVAIMDITFKGTDYRDLLDILIEANLKKVSGEQRAWRIVVDGQTYNLQGIADLICKKVGYEEPLADHHDQRLNADYHNRLIKRTQRGYGRTARNLADRALGVGAFGSPTPQQRAANMLPLSTHLPLPAVVGVYIEAAIQAAQKAGASPGLIAAILYAAAHAGFEEAGISPSANYPDSDREIVVDVLKLAPIKVDW